MRSISESTTLTLSLVLLLLGGVWSFAWAAFSTHQIVVDTSKATQEIAIEMRNAVSELRMEIQIETSKRVLRHEVDAWATEFRLMNPGINVPALPKFQ